MAQKKAQQKKKPQPSKQVSTQTKRPKSNPRLAPRMDPMDPCTEKFIKAYADPFGAHSDVCLPFGEKLPATCFRSFKRTMIQVNGTSAGYVSFDPALIYDANCVHLSNTAQSFAGGSFNTAAVDSSNMGSSSGNPISFAMLTGGQASVRHVMSAMRARYIGTELERGGVAFPWADKENYDLGGLGFAAFSSYPDVQSHSNNRQWVTVSLASDNTRLTGFVDDTAGVAANNFTVSNIVRRSAPTVAAQVGMPMTILVQNATTVTQAWEVEVVTYTEARWKTLMNNWMSHDFKEEQGSSFLASLGRSISPDGVIDAVRKMSKHLNVDTSRVFAQLVNNVTKAHSDARRIADTRSRFFAIME